MTRLPAAWADRPTDPTYGVPVPFACERDDGPYSLGTLNRKRVIQCALSRICGMCGRSLENPVVFVGSAEDADRLAFRVPPLHLACAQAALELYPPLAGPVLDYPERGSAWALVVTGGFELERPLHRGDRLTFRPNSVTADTRREF
ncbi:MAG: hypothetical protein ACXVWU_00080 [Nocardioides sp.]